MASLGSLPHLRSVRRQALDGLLRLAPVLPGPARKTTLDLETLLGARSLPAINLVPKL
jgi:hypothetical protein